MSEQPTIRFKVTDDRTELLPLGVYRQMDRDRDSLLYFLAHYLLADDGDYVLSYDDDGMYQAGLEQAWHIFDPLPIRQIKNMVEAIQGNVEESAVPKA